MSKNNYKRIGNAPLFHVVLSTGLGTGFVPIAPGTAGAFLALAVWYCLYLYLSASYLLWTHIFLIIVSKIVRRCTYNVLLEYWGKDLRCIDMYEVV